MDDYRLLLLGEGLTLSDDDFARAVTVLGQTHVPDRNATAAGEKFALELVTDPAFPEHPACEWSMARFVSSLPHLQDFDLADLARAWHERATPYAGRLRIRLVPDAPRDETPLRLPSPVFTEIISRPAVQVGGISVKVATPSADLRWQWPIRLNAAATSLPDGWLEYLAQTWPSSGLVECAGVSRERTRAEILLLDGPVREALRANLALPYELRAGLVILLDPLDEDWLAVTPLLEALLAQTQAGGALLWSPASRDAVPAALNALVIELSHANPLDVALGTVLRGGRYHALLSDHLVDAVSLPAAARRLAGTLLELPSTEKFPDPSIARHHLGLPKLDRPGPPRGAPDATSKSVHVGPYRKGGLYDAEVLSTDLTAHSDALTFSSPPVSSEGGAASGISAIRRAARSHRAEHAESAPRRFIQTQVWRKPQAGSPALERDSLQVGVRYALNIRVGGREREWLTADEPFPIEQLDWSRDRHTLQVVFTEPNQLERPLVGWMDVWASGTSQAVEFLFVPIKPGALQGRITLAYRGRVLQTALLTGEVLEPGKVQAPSQVPLKLTVEAEVRQSWADLDERRPFDVALVINRTADDRPTAAAISRRGAFLYSLDGVATQVSDINQRLTDVALDAKAYSTGLRSPKNVALLRDLAKQGAWMFRNLVIDQLAMTATASDLLESDYLQIVSAKPDALIPLEFIYDYPAPGPQAELCPNAEQALAKGLCPGCPSATSPAPYVCPLGFWGLRKVIERHVHAPTLAGTGAVADVRAEPHPHSDTLVMKGVSLFATSKEVPKGDRQRVQGQLEKSWTAGVVAVDGWKPWHDAVEKATPAIVLALPHATGAGAAIGLEISGDILESIYIDAQYLRPHAGDAKPIVCLFGCDTANTVRPETYANHVVAFRQGGAAIVLATIATVFGTHAARVAEYLIEALTEAAKSETPVRFGEILRDIKRRALLKSLPMALCLVAFGDADWQLGGGH